MLPPARIPNVHQLISSSISPDNCLLLLNESMNVPLVIANFILSHDQRTLCLFLDLEEMEILEINNHLTILKQEAIIAGQSVNLAAKMENINIINTKRKPAYQSFGFYAVSSVVLVLDLLCHLVHPSLVNMVWLRDAERVKSIHHNYAWIMEMIQRETGNCRSVAVSQAVSNLNRDTCL